MKSPDELAARLARQWQNADLRMQRLLQPAGWPLTLSIGRPSGAAVRDQTEPVRKHLQQWRSPPVGRVIWESARFQSTGDAIEIPKHWVLDSPSQWVSATGRADIQREYNILNRLATALDPRFHPLIVRRRRLVLDKPESDVIRSGEAALQLQPGCANGKPLRALSVAGNDSKFFERNRQLLTLMLDVLFAGEVSDTGLEAFLGAGEDGHHWLLVADLDGALLPYTQMRIRAQELRHMPLPGQRLILVENERCLHQLPRMNGTIAVLGAGLNLTWLKAPWLAARTIAYWGDLDTWGLTMLGLARQHLPHLAPLLMDRATFGAYQEGSAVEEPHPASKVSPPGLTDDEAALYRLLLAADRGRLEQEFLPETVVRDAIHDWAMNDKDKKTGP